MRGAVVAARHRGLRPDDLYIASYPRSGNTWVRFVLADLATGGPTDFEGIDRLVPSVGFHRDAPPLVDGGRILKTHEPHRREYVRAVYLVRDVRDVLVSWYRVTRPDPDDLDDLDAFVRSFCGEKASPYGGWTTHVRSWMDARARGLPILMLRFEDMRSQPTAAIDRIARFANISADECAIRAALGRNDSAAMHRLEVESRDYLRRSFGYQSRGVRSGAVGGWRALLSESHLRALEPALRLNRELGYPR